MKDLFIVTCGSVQMLPCVLLTSDSAAVSAAALLWLLLVLFVWTRTRIGRRYFAALWRATLRLERAVLGDVPEC